MFFDLEILNRRGGRFGVIWLAANDKIRFNGKGSRNDLRLLLSVDVSHICRDILSYVKIEHPARVPGESSPRFSLYLSAMLTHGAILVHDRQVRHELAHSRLSLQHKLVAEKRQRQRETNVDCSVLDLSNAQLEENENLFRDGATLAEQEFGRLADVVEALRISSGVHELRVNPEVRPGIGTPERIENDFMDLEAAFNNAIQDPNGHFASENDITLKEFDPLVRTNQIQDIDMFESDLNNSANPYGVDNFPDLSDQLPGNFGFMEVDENPFNVPANVPESTLKRPHVGPEDVDIPSKQRRNSTGEEPNFPPPAAADASEAALPLNFELEPLTDIEQCVRRKRRHRRLIDAELSIPVEIFKAQRENYVGTLRAETAVADRIACPQYLGCTAKDLLCRPSVSFRGSPLQRLITRNMVVCPQENADIDSITKEIRPSELVEATVVNVQRTSPFGAHQNTNTDLNIDGIMNSLHALDVFENSLHEVRPVAPVTTEETFQLPLPEDSGVEIETLRPGLSRDISYTGSIAINNSRVDLSGLEGSRTSLDPLPDRGNILETVKEVSIEVSQRTSSIVNSNRTARSTFVTLHEGVVMSDTQAQPPLPTKRQTSHADRIASYVPIPENSIPISLTPLQPEGQPSLVKVPTGENLLVMIKSAVEEVEGPLTFKQLVPPGKYNRIEAAKFFEQLLWLKKERKIDLHQEPSHEFPYKDIQIFLE